MKNSALSFLTLEFPNRSENHSTEALYGAGVDGACNGFQGEAFLASWYTWSCTVCLVSAIKLPLAH